MSRRVARGSAVLTQQSDGALQPLMKLKEMEYMEKIAEKIHGISINGGDQVLDQLRQLFVRQ